MQLTKEQILKIEKYLDTKGVNYIDFRIEIFDHIVTEIEDKIDKNSNFEVTFNEVTNQWNRYLNKTSSFNLGWTYYAPKVVIKKAEKIYRKKYVPTILLVVIPLITFMFLNLELYKEIFTKLISNLFLISSITTALFSFIIFKTLTETTKTVYSFIIRTKAMYIGILLFTIIISFFKVYLFELFLLCFFDFIYVVFLYKKHLTEIKKYELIIK